MDEINKRMATAADRANKVLDDDDTKPEPGSASRTEEASRSDISQESKRSLQDLENTEVLVSQPLELWSKDDLVAAATKYGVKIDVLRLLPKRC